MGAELQQGEAVIILLVGQACASELAELQQGEAVITRMGGLNAADGIRNGVNKSRGHIKGSNNAANDRDEARYWENAARAAWARGDRAAAEKAQAQFTYYQQRALQYSR